MKRILASLSITALLLSASLAALPTQTASAAECSESNFFLPRWFDGLCKQGTDEIESPGADEFKGSGAGGATEGTASGIGKWLTILALNLVTILLTIVGYVSLGFIIFGGFKYMTSGESSSGTVAARKTITNAIIGLVLSIMSVAIVKFVAGVV